MVDLRELYQEIILENNRNPRHHHAMTHPTCSARGVNPLCGDKLTVYVKCDQGRIGEVSFLGSGCAISQASASLMTEALQGKTVEQAHTLFHQFHDMLTKDDDTHIETLKKLAVLAGVRAYPARVKCATLAWHTLESALNEDNQLVSTE